MTKIKKPEKRSYKFSCWMKPSVKAKLDRLAKENGVSQADVIESLIKEED